MSGNPPIAALALLLGAAAAGAQPALSNQDCEVLAKAVKEYVWRAATDAQPATSTVRPLAAAFGSERRVCRRTAEVTTRAFTQAFQSFSLAIGWEPPDPGDYCLSGDLSQCYPGLDDPRVPRSHLSFVYEAWHGVSRAVQSLMPAGSAGGVAVFSEAALDEALAAQLERSVAAPLFARRVR